MEVRLYWQEYDELCMANDTILPGETFEEILAQARVDFKDNEGFNGPVLALIQGGSDGI